MTSQRAPKAGLADRSQFLLSAAVQTGFGPFFSVYLTEQGWSQADIGFALSVGTVSALLLQLPAGALVDAIHHKRFAIAVALLLTGISAMMLVATPTQEPVLTRR